MKTGIIRRIDDLGRIAIPKEIRQEMAIKEGDPLEISLEDNKVCFEKYITSHEYGKHLTQLINRMMSDEVTDKTLKAISLIEQARAILFKSEEWYYT